MPIVALIFRQLVVMPKPRVGRYHIEDAGNGQYFVSLETVPQDFLALAIKRALDIIGAILGLMLCALVFPFYAVVVTNRVAAARFCSTRNGWDAMDVSLPCTSFAPCGPMPSGSFPS